MNVLGIALLAACGSSQPTTTTPGDTPAPVQDTPMEAPAEQAAKPEEEPAAKPAPPKPLSLEERIAFHDSCFHDFIKETPGFFAKCYSDDSSELLVDSGDPPGQGVSGVRSANKPFWDAFALDGELILNLANGEKVATLALVAGVQDGEFMGMAPAGGKFGLLSLEIQNLDAQGRHGTVHNYVNFAAFMAQLTTPKGAPKGVRAAMVKTGAESETVIATDSDDEKANVALIQNGMELFNKKDLKGLAALYAADAVISDQMNPADTKGSKAIQKMFKDLNKAFPDAKEEVVDIWGAGDYVVAETVFTGTNKAAAPTMGIPKATKKSVTLHTAHLFKVDDGKVAQHWILGNGMAMAMQLGLIKPPPAAPPAK